MLCGCMTKKLYLLLFVVGAGAWLYWMAPWMMANGFNVQAIWDAMCANTVCMASCMSKCLASLTVILACVSEGMCGRMRMAWLPAVVTVVMSVGAGLPLYLAMRDNGGSCSCSAMS